MRHPHPDATAGVLDQLAEGTVIDDLVCNRRQASRLLQPIAPHQDASPSRACFALLVIVHPAKRVKLGKEVDKGRDQEPIPTAFHA